MRGRGERAGVRRRVRHPANAKLAVLCGWISVSLVVREKEMQSDSERLERAGFHGVESEKTDQKGQLRAGRGGEETFEEI